VFNKHLFDSALSTAVITLSQRGTRAASGWFSIDRVWEDGRKETYHEINICPEELNQPIEHICAILLHEMVHLYCALNGIKDCSRGSQYHNKEFKIYAERHGLSVQKHSAYGYAITALTPKTLDYIRSLDLKAFDLFRKERMSMRFGDDGSEDSADDDESGDEPEKTHPRTSSTRKYICPGCDTSIRATKDVRVRCEDCDLLFEADEKSCQAA